MNVFTPDDIDFSLYMENTETQRRIRPSGSYVEDVIRYIWDDTSHTGASLPWDKCLAQLRFRRGEVTLWGGFNGAGKSAVLGQVCLGFVQQAHRTCIASFEMPPPSTLARICRQAFGCVRPPQDEIRAFHEVVDQHIWLYDQRGMVKSETVLAVVRYAATVLNCDHIIIDSLMKCGLPEDGTMAFNAQKDFIDALCRAAQETGIHVHLVAHSRKGRDESAPPGKMDIKGSGSITDQVDNVVIIWRNKPKEQAEAAGNPQSVMEPDTMLIVEKQRHFEWEGRILLWYLRGSQQFVGEPNGMPIDMLKPKVSQ